MDWIIKLGIFFIIIIGCALFIYAYFYLNSMIFMHDKLKRENGLILSHNKYIYFEHKGNNGIGIIYNKNDDEKFPDYYVSCIYDDKSVQNLKLNEIDNYKFIDK